MTNAHFKKNSMSELLRHGVFVKRNPLSTETRSEPVFESEVFGRVGLGFVAFYFKCIIYVFVVVRIQPIFCGCNRIISVIHRENDIAGTCLRCRHGSRRKYACESAIHGCRVIADKRTANIADDNLRNPVCLATEIKMFVSGNIRSHMMIRQQFPKLILEGCLIK